MNQLRAAGRAPTGSEHRLVSKSSQELAKANRSLVVVVVEFVMLIPVALVSIGQPTVEKNCAGWPAASV